MPAGRPRGGGADGRERILGAALEEFAERGYSAASIAAIARRARVAKSVIYHHFQSKGGLYEAIVRDQTADLLESVSAAVPDDLEAPRLRPGVDAYFAFLRSRRTVWRLLFRDPPADPELFEIHRRLEGERAALLGSLLTRSAKRGRRGERLVADLVTTAIRTFGAWWYDHPRIPRSVVVDAVMDVAAAGAERLTATRSPARSPASRS